MYQFKPMENSSLIIFQFLFENLLVEVCGVLVNVLLKLHSNSLFIGIKLSDDVCIMILKQFEVLSQHFPSYLLVSNMVNAVPYSHKLLAIFLLGAFS